jgi:hypothetical protein
MTPIRLPLLPSAIRQQINRLAHSAGVRHGIETKARLTAELSKLLASGARPTELAAHLAKEVHQD